MSSPRLHSMINRVLDELGALGNTRKRRFLRKVRAVLAQARQGWASADYGVGYLYQSSPLLGLRGFRDTGARVGQMSLSQALQGRAVLEIGCNSGFLALALATGTRRYVAFDNNPYLIELAQLAQREAGIGAVEFRVSTIEALGTDEQFEVVLSFANHSTWDGNMTLALEDYFSKVHRLLVPGGRLYFESHHPVLENRQQVQATLAVMRRFFEVEEERELVEGSAWDRGRTFVTARAPAVPA